MYNVFVFDSASGTRVFLRAFLRFESLRTIPFMALVPMNVLAAFRTIIRVAHDWLWPAINEYEIRLYLFEQFEFGR